MIALMTMEHFRCKNPEWPILADSGFYIFRNDCVAKEFQLENQQPESGM